MKKACIVGFGAIGTVHTRAVAKSQYGSVYAICDCVKEKADKGAKIYKAKAFYDFDEMLKDEEIEAVHICTPHYLHKQMAVAALSHGKNIVLEKPLSIHISDLDEIWEAYQGSSKKACIMLQNRTNHSVEIMKKLVDTDDTLGKMIGICGFMTWHRDENYYRSGDWRGAWETEGGGLLINQAIHMIDLIDWLGGGIQSLKSNISTKSLNDEVEVEDTADALFLMNNGCRGVFYATNAYVCDAPFRVEINFEHATLRYADGRLYKITADTTEVLATDAQACDGKQCWGGSHLGVINGFYDALETGTGEYIDLAEGFHSAKVMLSMYEVGLSARKDWIKI